MKKTILLPLLISVVLASGCTGTEVIGGGLFVSLAPDPPDVFSSGTVRLNIDIDNKNPRTITDVDVHVFNTGILAERQDSPACRLQVSTMRPEEFRTFFCVLQAPPKGDIIENRVSTYVDARAEYTTDLPVTQIVEMMTESVYVQRQQSGRLKTNPSSYRYSDKNVEVLVEFSDTLPILIRTSEQRDYFVYFTVKNIGNGFVRALNPGDLALAPVGYSAPRILECPDFAPSSGNTIVLNRRLEPLGKEFPRIACRLMMPTGVTVVENYGLLVNLKYRYEVRERADITVMR